MIPSSNSLTKSSLNNIPMFKQASSINGSNKSLLGIYVNNNDSFSRYNKSQTAADNVNSISNSFFRTNSQKSLIIERDKSASKLFKKIEDIK
jgi:hypothetical protein